MNLFHIVSCQIFSGGRNNDTMGFFLCGAFGRTVFDSSLPMAVIPVFIGKGKKRVKKNKVISSLCGDERDSCVSSAHHCHVGFAKSDSAR